MVARYTIAMRTSKYARATQTVVSMPRDTLSQRMELCIAHLNLTRLIDALGSRYHGAGPTVTALYAAWLAGEHNLFALRDALFEAGRPYLAELIP